MIKVHFYDAETGLFTGRSFSGPLGDHDINTPAGMKAWEDAVDPLSQRVDLASGELIDYQPPAPSRDHAWNAGTKRWEMTAAGHARDIARSRIEQLEGSQHRALREHMLGYDGAAARLKALDEEIATFRAILTAAPIQRPDSPVPPAAADSST